jgi:hypothetical protein
MSLKKLDSTFRALLFLLFLSGVTFSQFISKPINRPDFFPLFNWDLFSNPAATVTIYRLEPVDGSSSKGTYTVRDNRIFPFRLKEAAHLASNENDREAARALIIDSVQVHNKSVGLQLVELVVDSREYLLLGNYLKRTIILDLSREQF